MNDTPRAERPKRRRLETVHVPRPRCPACNSAELIKYRSVKQDDGGRLAWMRCRRPECGKRFRILSE